MDIEYILNKLVKVRSTGHNKWVACCPAHEDRSPSLGIKLFDEGNIGLKCFAGCSIDQITGSLGLKVSDLFSESGKFDYDQYRQKKSIENIKDQLEYYKIVLLVAKGSRKNGVKLSNEDLALERKAFIMVRELKKALMAGPKK